MDKLLLFPGKSERGIFTYVIDAERMYLEKTAAEYHPTIASYIRAAKPLPGRTQILLTALGAGEWWGDNVNGDYFEEAELAHEGDDYGHKTFEKYAKVYKHHVNKDPSAGYGDVPLSVYNPTFHRVELIVSVMNDRAPDIVERMDRGDYPDWSMGCRVPYDVCNVCGNRAPTRKQYCTHARYLMGRIDPETGKKVFVRNPRPRFFDISMVLIGADRIAKTHMKVAAAARAYHLSSAELAEKMAEAEKGAVERKRATIEKEIPPNQPPSSAEAVRTLVRSIPEVKSREASLPTEVLNRLGAAPLPQSLSTLAMLGILPKPHEFQRIVLVSLGRRADADALDREGRAFDPLSEVTPPAGLERAMGLGGANFSSTLMQLLSPFMAERSYATPHLGPRLVVMIKRGSQERLPTFIKVGNDTGNSDERKPIGIIPMLGLAAAMYAIYSRNAPQEALTGVSKLITQHPGLATLLGLGLYTAFHHGTDIGGAADLRGNYRPGEVHQDPDVNDVFARIEEQKAKPYLKLGSLSAASKRLFLGVPAAYMASGILQKHREMTPGDEENRVKAFIRKNPDVVSGALIADAMLALRGKGTHGAAVWTKERAKSLFKRACDAAEDVVGPTPFLKTASAAEFLAGALVPALALGKTNLPGRVVGGLVDQAALEVAGHYLRKHEAKVNQGLD